jgi:hypothetical protein
MHGSFVQMAPTALWRECQHRHWYFFPWHRMYLYFFERIVRAAVVSAGGPDDFALPYWNYDQPNPRNMLPEPFRQQTLPDGSANPLYVAPPGRVTALNNGTAGLSPQATSSSAAMNLTNFTDDPSSFTTFGGSRRPPEHFALPAFMGQLENQPHNAVHGAIGGGVAGQCGGGLMSDPWCAALDPIFWVHHAHIDRLWDEWLARGGGRANPSDTAWRNQSFRFHDETGAQVSMTAADVLDTKRLGYAYV